MAFALQPRKITVKPRSGHQFSATEEKSFKYEAQSALFKDPVRTAQ